MNDFLPFQSERIFKGPGIAETLYLGVCDGRRVIRKMSNPDALDFSRTALVREINMLRNLPSELRPHYIEFIRTNLPENAADNPASGGTLPDGDIWYDMPYLNPDDGWQTWSQCLLEDSLSQAARDKSLAEVTATAFMTFSLDAHITDDDYIENTMLKSMRESLAWAESCVEISSLLRYGSLNINGEYYSNINEMVNIIDDNPQVVKNLLKPNKDRLLHGDFFPENIMYNTKRCECLFLDPVSVRGVHRGDFILDLLKMEEWLSGELPALRSGEFSCKIERHEIEFELFSDKGPFEKLANSGLINYYRELQQSHEYSGIFAEESGWEIRREFIKAFYALSILPLVGREQACARYVLAVKALNRFLELCGLHK